MDAAVVSDIARRYHVKLVLQHGSTVTGHVHARSDLDLAVLFESEHATLRNLLDFAQELQTLVPGQDVDAAAINHADPLFLKKILENCLLLHGDPRALAELRMYAFRRYQDHRPFLAMERQYVRSQAPRVAQR